LCRQGLQHFILLGHEFISFLGSAFLFKQFDFGLFLIRDVRVDCHGAAFSRFVFCNLYPTVVSAALHKGASRIAMPFHPLGNPFVDAALRILHKAGFRRIPEDRIERHPWLYRVLHSGIQEFQILPVRQNQPVVPIIERKAFRNALDGVDQPLARLGNFTEIVLLDLDRSIAKYGQRFGHITDLVAAARSRQRGMQIATRNSQHALAESCQVHHEVAIDIHIRECQE